jgi:hypothetical protein
MDYNILLKIYVKIFIKVNSYMTTYKEISVVSLILL